MVRKHGFVSFTNRVAAIKIDPIRRADKNKILIDDESAESLFMSALEKWNELNLASRYTSFSRQCAQLVQSLPMLLHNQSAVFELLISSIETSDEYSAEALLDLLVNFARDLGEDFECYYAKALHTCIALIEKYQRDDKMLDIVELTFNCLAHLFKYLSRLLTANLIPTYDVMLPLFGGVKGSKQRSFVLRFAAESMAFLLRRAKKDSLSAIIDHIASQASADPLNEQYLISSSQLLSTALEGPQTSLHSKAPLLLEQYIESCYKFNSTILLCHTLVEILHHTRRDSSSPIYDTVTASLTKNKGEFGARCLFVLAGFRKGDRVNDWKQLYRALIMIAPSGTATLSWTQAASAIISYSDLVSTSKYLEEVLQTSSDLETVSTILETVSKFNPEVLSTYDTIIWDCLLTKVSADKVEQLKELSLLLMNVELSKSALATKFLAKLNVNELLEQVKIDDDDNGRSLFSLWWRLQLFDRLHGDRSDLFRKICKLNFASHEHVLKAFQSVVAAEILQISDKLTSNDDIQLCCKLEPLPILFDSIGNNVELNEVTRKLLLENLSEGLFRCLASCDKKSRAAALQLLKKLTNSIENPLEECLVINELPLDLHNARDISHRLRNLATRYKNAQVNDFDTKVVSKSVLCFFFGMVTVRLQPVFNTVMSLITKLAEKDAPEICKLALRFIQNPSPEYNSDDLDFGIFSEEFMDSSLDEHSQFEKLNCHTLTSIHEVSKNSWQDIERLDEALENKAKAMIHLEHYDDLRTLGTKILGQIPQIAEREAAAILVPYLLHVDDDDDEENEQENESIAEKGNTSFSFTDKISLLELFSQLKHPERLPNFASVYARYMFFLGSRHTPLQRLGLKCLMAVSSTGTKLLRKYSLNMEALLDDKRFRDELTSFICVGENQADEGSLHSEDRQEVIPFIVNILYGRAQNSNKRNMRHAVLSSLHFLEPEFRHMFIELAHSHLMDSKALSPDADFDDRSVTRKVQGYLTLMNDTIHHLKSSATEVIPFIVNNGIFAILSKIDLANNKTLRQLITKALDEMLKIAPSKDIWQSLFPNVYRLLVEPQLMDFGMKNRENPSALMNMLLTISGERGLIDFMNSDMMIAVTSCLDNSMVKDSVLIEVLKIIINMTALKPTSNVTTIGISKTIKELPAKLDTELSPECFSVAIETVNKIFSMGLDSFDSTIIHNLALLSFKTLQRPSRVVPLNVKSAVLLALSHILNSPSCSSELIMMAYDSLAPLFRQFVDRDSRVHLSACFEVFGKRIPAYYRVGKLIVELNSFNEQRLGEPDFTRRSIAFEEINEKLWTELNHTEWKPLVFNMLFFMRDPEELALRNNGKFALMRLIESRNAPELVSNYVLPAIKKGLRDSDDKFGRLYIDLLGQCAYHNVIPSLRVLLFHGDEEADFFINVNHVQVHRRRRAIQRLGKLSEEIDESIIAHYLLSIAENFAMYSGSKNSDMNNLADDALHTITLLLRHVSAGQFKSVARRWVQNVVQGPEPAKLRKHARIVTAVAQATPKGIDTFILNGLVPPLQRILTAKSNEHENLPDRIPLAVAIVYFLKGLNEEDLEKNLSGKLTSLCQLLRSKIPELRDTVRQSLGRIMRILGPKYLNFVVCELRGALRKGGLQSHVLGFTVHSLLVELDRRGKDAQLSVGDTDDCAGIIFRIVMDDTFGSIGEEKDNEGYVTASKEVKQHKSYDTAEILATWTSLAQFGKIIEPMREFLSLTKLSTRNEHKIEEVLRRLASGLHKNPQAGTQDAVVMGYEIYKLCEDLINENVQSADEISKQKELSGALAARDQAAKESEEFFTVRLSSRDWYDGRQGTGRGAVISRYAPANLHLLQTFALDTLRSVLTSTSGGATSEGGKGLLTVPNIKGLAPIIVQGLQSTFEDLNIAALRIATMAFRLPVPFAGGDNTLEICGDRALKLIEASPNTNNLICQTALKFLTMLIRSKPEFELSSGAVAYILERLRPDLEEPERQGTAISFVRAIFTKKVMLPQVYDVADTLSKVLVTNQSEHIRINCRTAYMQFLTSYPLGQTRLDRHLDALGANLRYAAPSGRLSVMEMIHNLLQKISIDQLEPSLISYFASLVLVLVTDVEPSCRQRAKTVVEEILNAASSSSIRDQIVTHCLQWLGSLGKNDMLVRGGLEVSIMLSGKPWASDIAKKLSTVVGDILQRGQRDSDSNIDWQLIYLALGTDNALEMIDLVEGVLLFPHPWVRSRAARIFGHYFKITPKSDIEPNLLVHVGHKLVRQLGAPRLSSNETLQIVKDLVFIIPIWDSEGMKMPSAPRAEKEENVSDETKLCTEWLVNKLGSMIRTDISAAEFVQSKTGAIQVLASLPSLISHQTLTEVAYEIIKSLYVLIDQLDMEGVHFELRDLAQEAMSLYDNSLGTTEYYKRYNDARQFVHNRRRERRTRRAIEAIADPEIAAQKRIKRNVHKRDVRKEKKRKFH